MYMYFEFFNWFLDVELGQSNWWLVQPGLVDLFRVYNVGLLRQRREPGNEIERHFVTFTHPPSQLPQALSFIGGDRVAALLF